MIEFEEKDGKLLQVKPPCDHVWSRWSPTIDSDGVVNRRDCFRCHEYQLLVPHGYDKLKTELEIENKEASRSIVVGIFQVAIGLFLYGCIKYLWF